MKVAMVAYGHPDNVLCLASYLANHIDITLVLVMGGDRFTKSILDMDIRKLDYGITIDRNIVGTYLGERLVRSLNPDLKVLIARTPTLKILQDWKLRNLRYIRSVAAYLLKQKYDLIHFNGSSGFQIFFNYYLRNLPKVYTIHDYLPHTGEVKPKIRLFNTLQNKFYAAQDYMFIQHYHYLRDKFAEYYHVSPSKVHAIHCGPLELYRSFDDENTKEDNHTILYFGRISAYKGIEYLIKAIPEVKKHIPDLKVIIAGKGNLSIDLDPSTEVHNYHIPNRILVRFIKRASVVVAPYIDATHSAVIMTAYAFEKPVVATNVGGIPEVVRDGITGRLVESRDHIALSNALVDLLTNQRKREKMKKNINKLSYDGRLSWHKIARQTIDVYNKTISSYRL